MALSIAFYRILVDARPIVVMAPTNTSITRTVVQL